MAKLIKVLLAIFLPPIAVLIERGIGVSLLLNILLTLIGVIPGSIHAVLVILDEA
ncbi:MAG: YqaE/Pmp3 family membrane protein [Planctomycetota bacterium]